MSNEIEKFISLEKFNPEYCEILNKFWRYIAKFNKEIDPDFIARQFFTDDGIINPRHTNNELTHIIEPIEQLYIKACRDGKYSEKLQQTSEYKLPTSKSSLIRAKNYSLNFSYMKTNFADIDVDALDFQNKNSGAADLPESFEFQDLQLAVKMIGSSFGVEKLGENLNTTSRQYGTKLPFQDDIDDFLNNSDWEVIATKGSKYTFHNETDGGVQLVAFKNKINGDVWIASPGMETDRGFASIRADGHAARKTLWGKPSEQTIPTVDFIMDLRNSGHNVTKLIGQSTSTGSITAAGLLLNIPIMNIEPATQGPEVVRNIIEFAKNNKAHLETAGVNLENINSSEIVSRLSSVTNVFTSMNLWSACGSYPYTNKNFMLLPEKGLPNFNNNGADPLLNGWYKNHSFTQTYGGLKGFGGEDKVGMSNAKPTDFVHVSGLDNPKSKRSIGMGRLYDSPAYGDMIPAKRAFFKKIFGAEDSKLEFTRINGLDNQGRVAWGDKVKYTSPRNIISYTVST